MQINLPSTMVGTTYSPRTLSYLHNCYNLGGVIVRRSEFIELDSISGSAPALYGKYPRGQVVSRDGLYLYGVYSDSLYIWGVVKLAFRHQLGL